MTETISKYRMMVKLSSLGCETVGRMSGAWEILYREHPELGLESCEEVEHIGRTVTRMGLFESIGRKRFCLTPAGRQLANLVQPGERVMSQLEDAVKRSSEEWRTIYKGDCE